MCDLEKLYYQKEFFVYIKSLVNEYNKMKVNRLHVSLNINPNIVESHLNNIFDEMFYYLISIKLCLDNYLVV